jgi:hypothetical protein
MRKRIAIALATGVAAATVGFGATSTASAAPNGAGNGGKPAGITCMQFGLAGLRSVDAPAKVSLELTGLPLNQVLALHRNNPAAAGGVLKSLGFDPAAVDAACPPA